MLRHPDRSPFLSSPSPLVSSSTSLARSWTTIPAWTSTTSSTAAGSPDSRFGPAGLSQVELDAMDKVSGDEFHNLPPVVRRKFFSTLERLRYAQAATVPSQLDPSLRRRVSAKALAGSRSPSIRRRSSGRLSKSPSVARRIVTKVDARWYLDLPDKVKSRHFTREERSFLNGKCASVIMDAADDAFYKRRPTQSPPLSPRTRPRSSRARPRASLESAKDQTLVNSVDFGEDVEDSMQWLDDDGDLDLRLRLDDYHANMVPDITVKPLPADGRSRRPSFRRAAFYASRLSSRNWTLPIQPTSRAPKEHRPRERKRSITGLPVGPAREERGSISSVDAGAMYYRDPEARLRLRVYLASPQKLDEAIEFGFPSADQAKVEGEANPWASKSGIRFSRSDFQTFLEDADDDIPTLPLDRQQQHDDDDDDEGSDGLLGHEDDDDDDEASLPDPDQPATPVEVDTAFRSPHRLPYAAKLHSPDSTTPRPAGTPRPRHFESYAYAPALNREMTLRITLTRPDLDPAERDNDNNNNHKNNNNNNNNNHDSNRTGPRGSHVWPVRAKDDPLDLGDHLLMGPSVAGCGPHISHSNISDEAHDGLVKKFWKKIVKPGRKSV